MGEIWKILGVLWAKGMEGDCCDIGQVAVVGSDWGLHMQWGRGAILDVSRHSALRFQVAFLSIIEHFGACAAGGNGPLT